MFPIKIMLHVNDTFTFIVFFFANLNFVFASGRRKLWFEITGFNAQAIFLVFLVSNFETREGLKVNQHFDKFVVNQSVFKHAQKMFHNNSHSVSLLETIWMQCKTARLGSIITVLFHVANLSFCVSTIKFRAFLELFRRVYYLCLPKLYFFLSFSSCLTFFFLSSQICAQATSKIKKNSLVVLWQKSASFYFTVTFSSSLYDCGYQHGWHWNWLFELQSCTD